MVVRIWEVRTNNHWFVNYFIFGRVLMLLSFPSSVWCFHVLCVFWVCSNVWLIFKWTKLMKPSNYLVIYWHEISTQNWRFLSSESSSSSVRVHTLISMHINWLRHNFDHNLKFGTFSNGNRKSFRVFVACAAHKWRSKWMLYRNDEIDFEGMKKKKKKKKQ